MRNLRKDVAGKPKVGAGLTPHKFSIALMLLLTACISINGCRTANQPVKESPEQQSKPARTMSVKADRENTQMDDAIYLAPNGDDNAAGSLEAPLANLAAAVERFRENNIKRIVARGGEYFNTQVNLGSGDSGMTIQAYENEPPVFYGGRRVSGWRKDGERFWAAEVPGVKEGKLDFRLLSVNGKLRPRARIPQEGRLQHKSEFKVRWMSTTAGGWQRKPTPEELSTMVYNPEDIPADVDIRNAEITVFHQWDESCLRLSKIDTDTRTITFASPAGHPPGAFGVKDYIVWNIREGMTQPGQWYLDRPRGLLVYYPLPGEKMNETQAILPAAECIVNIRGSKEAPVNELRLRGLSFAVTNAPAISGGFGATAFDGAIRAANTVDCSFTDLAVFNTAGQGIRAENGSNIRIEDCEIYQTGASGLLIRSSSGTIRRNHVHHTGRLYPSSMGMHLPGLTSSVVSRNHIHDTTYSAIASGGCNGSLFEHNLFHDYMTELNDGAAIYVTFCKDVTIRKNKATGTSGRLAHAYYLDEQAENCVVEENIAVNTRWSSHNHMARNCTIRNNIFYDEGTSRLTFPRSSGFRLERNVIYAKDAITICTPPDGIASWRNNIFYSASGEVVLETLGDYAGTGKKPLELTDGSISADPEFANPAERDFRFKEDSPARRLGIRQVEVEW